MNLNHNENQSLSNYRVVPRLVKAGVKETVTIYPIGKCMAFDDSVEYEVRFIPMELYTQDRLEYSMDVWDTVKAHSKGGIISVEYTFEGEQEWIILIPHKYSNGEEFRFEAHVYSLEEDLYALNPYMGDLHSHSFGSDGLNSPEIMAANYRKQGYDFVALTDHFKLSPSLEMIKAYEDVPIPIKLFQGEEVHRPSSWLHVVNFGGKYSVNDLYDKNKEKIDAELKAEAEKIKVPKGINAYEYVCRKWISTEIRKSGGFVIIPHPYWHFQKTYHVSSVMLDYIFETGLHDAFELIGAPGMHEINLQIAFYQDQRAKGRNIPIVGSSDSHDTDPVIHFGEGRTVLFAKDLEFDTVCDAIRNGYTAAIRQEYGESARVYGTYRMVKYARFLLDYYFPAHDELCVEEGILMREYALGDENAKEKLLSLDGRTAKYMNWVLKAKK